MKTLNKIKEKQKYSLLSLDDFEILVNFYNQEQYLNELKEILEEEIRKRSNCIEKLYKYQNLLHKQFRYRKPNPNDLRDVLREKLDAVILDEFRKQNSSLGNDYIYKRITYDQYQQKTNKLSERVLKLLLKVKIIYNETN